MSTVLPFESRITCGKLLNDNLVFFAFTGEGNDSGKSYVCIVRKLNEDGDVEIGVPMEFEDREITDIAMWSDDGSKDALVAYKLVVPDAEDTQPDKAFVIKYTEDSSEIVNNVKLNFDRSESLNLNFIWMMQGGADEFVAKTKTENEGGEGVKPEITYNEDGSVKNVTMPKGYKLPKGIKKKESYSQKLRNRRKKALVPDTDEDIEDMIPASEAIIDVEPVVDIALPGDSTGE